VVESITYYRIFCHRSPQGKLFVAKSHETGLQTEPSSSADVPTYTYIYPYYMVYNKIIICVFVFSKTRWPPVSIARTCNSIILSWRSVGKMVKRARISTDIGYVLSYTARRYSRYFHVLILLLCSLAGGIL